MTAPIVSWHNNRFILEPHDWPISGDDDVTHYTALGQLWQRVAEG